MKGKQQKKISVVIPTYDEEKRIYKTIKKIINYLKSRNYSFEIIVVDDGSKDKTTEIVRQIRDKRLRVISYDKNKGKGYAVKTGMLAAKNNLALFCDADLSTPIEELDNFMKFVDDYDIIVGSRVIEGHKILKKQPFLRVFLGIVFSKITKTILDTGLQDTQCGFKLFRNCRDILKKQTIDGFAFDVEILFLARRKGLKILELPIVWKNVRGSKLNPLKDSLNMFKDILKIRKNFITGVYK
jgi:dolichyl-phosphate beta-glucosyltransferase